MTTPIAIEGLRQVRLGLLSRRDLLSRLTGTVVEIGSGAGRNLPDLPASVDWIGTEPNRRLRTTLAAAARERGLRPPLAARAEALPVETGSADVVLSVVVLCSVDDVDAGLREARRVRRTGPVSCAPASTPT
ncbi:hypothetical protein GCM10011512_09120 [Tersicoccus solisilvae]|uniref:Methyltransferase type 11 domain-containing protein n=1 Tax=Tersicoccus solisilvae TaxID=1882339 RepID=A0ABQ1NWN0_9MICC|nr:class I SAM-dependent methyltransferase [Tersicoccus solisilvae]GGC84459.1 hypothetical protein GCM10011512_09120 [Tersicoccus solisilvae]